MNCSICGKKIRWWHKVIFFAYAPCPGPWPMFVHRKCGDDYRPGSKHP